MTEVELLDQFAANVDISFEQAQRLAEAIRKPGEEISTKFILRVMAAVKLQAAEEMVRMRRNYLREGPRKCSRRRVTYPHNTEII